MIYIVHRGMGGKYTAYLRESVKRIGRHQSVDLSHDTPARPGFRVAVCHGGTPLTQEKIKEILSKKCVTFFVGDSRGLPQNIMDESDEIVSVSGLPIPHQLEAAIIADQIEHVVAYGS